MDSFDLTPQIDAICAKYPDAYRSPDALRELSELWGGVDCNDGGVILTREVIKIELQGNPRWRGEIRLADAPNGRWAMSTSYDYSTGGGGGAPSVWNRRAYANRDAAITAGLTNLVELFEDVRDWPSATEGEARLAGRMVEQLANHQHQSKQLTLF